MSVESVLDTNILIYAMPRAEEDARKHGIARELVAKSDFGVSGQILQEFFVIATTKIKLRLTVDEASHVVSWLSRLSCIPVEGDLILKGIDILRRYQISYWDAAIVAAAQILNAKTLYSEDLNHNQIYGSVRVVNPFLSS